MPLGNLQAGSSTSHLTDLVNKWFLGMNEPESAKAYSPVGGTLFGSPGPSTPTCSKGPPAIAG